MTAWEVIEEALAHRKPPRNMTWLAGELGETIQTVHNWKTRGVPARRIRQVAECLGLTIDQVEGLEPLPWVDAQLLTPEVSEVAQGLAGLNRYQVNWAMRAIRKTLAAAPKAAPTVRARRADNDESSSSRRTSK